MIIMSPYDKMHISVGSVRCANERRQYGALLMVTGLCAIFTPIGQLVTAINSNGLDQDIDEDLSSTTFWAFIGSVCVMVIGLAAFFTGFAECIHDAGSTRVTAWTMLLTQVRVVSTFLKQQLVFCREALLDYNHDFVWRGTIVC